MPRWRCREVQPACCVLLEEVLGRMLRALPGSASLAAMLPAIVSTLAEALQQQHAQQQQQQQQQDGQPDSPAAQHMLRLVEGLTVNCPAQLQPALKQVCAGWGWP